MDVDDGDEYMNAAAAHAAFVMAVSAARMYWLLRHIQKLHPLPKKISLDSTDFLHSGTPLLGTRHRQSTQHFAVEQCVYQLVCKFHAFNEAHI